MSNDKFTPGPWHVDLANETVHGFSSESEAIVVVYELGTNEADAHLLAAAPELLEALVDVMFRHVPFSDKSAYAEKARVAIAKATGAQQ